MSALPPVSPEAASARPARASRLFGDLAADRFEILRLALSPGEHWRYAIDPGCALMAFNFAGPAILESSGGNPVSFSGASVAFCPAGSSAGTEASTLVWPADTNRTALLVTLRPEFLREMIGARRTALGTRFVQAIFEDAGAPVVQPLHAALAQWIDSLKAPSIQGAAAKSLWAEGKLRELMALYCFAPETPEEEFFCTRQKRLASERVERAKAHMQANLDETLDLKALAESVGCSAHYLSRTFSEYCGMTISQYLRQIRIERAASLLSSGRYNVSEAAIEVGYNSLSHFSKAFQKEKGCLPSRYVPQAA